ncbi:MAG TPA: Piwi domain-containing protein, partial [Ktedonobacteraceae bacterium]|nr:Piwi domain-containing protein [Ktedonobacteraceae bacterium]
MSTVGGKFALHLAQAFPGRWVWSEKHILADQPQSEAAMQQVIEKLWQEHPDPFAQLMRVTQDVTWPVTAQAQADFVARGIIPERMGALQKILGKHARTLGSVQIVREVAVRGWVVAGQPALSLTLSSRVAAVQDLKTYARQLANPEQLVGLMVQEKYLHMKGDITGIAGTVVENRTRLLGKALKPSSKQVIQQAADDELVVQVQVTKQREPYDIVISALQIIVRTEDYKRFHVNGSQALTALRMAPWQRATILRELLPALNSPQPIIRSSYASSRQQSQFLRAADVGFQPQVLVGNGQRINADTLFGPLHKHGLYRRNAEFASRPLKIGVVCAVPDVAESVRTNFLPLLRKELQTLQFACQGVGIMRDVSLTHAALENAINRVQAQHPDLIIGVLPDADFNRTQMNRVWGPYEHFKSLTVGMGIPSQVVELSTIQQIINDPAKSQFVMGNIALGVVSKVGNIPYVLASPLPYADIVVGIDIARRRKERLAGSMNATALARVYLDTGMFLQYAISDAPLEGETIPEHVLQTFFPQRLFEGKRILIHRDGIFRGNEKQVLKERAQQLGAKIMLVEVLKTGTPRLYGMKNRVIDLPAKGSAFKLSEQEAFVVSTPPPFKGATPAPLHIRVDPPFTIEEAIHSILSLTLLHYGSLRQPRLPVTLHYSDEIA